MEYVLGEPLGRVLDRHPNGLPANLAKEWFLSLARAVGYLHDKLVVHRDLKPANIFVEDGQMKVGDFGLCKRMGGSSHPAEQSQGVGTAYYMAPEIDKGQYGKSIDVYACGVILYEMLTGAVPFTGGSPLEILHRHLTDAPDLSKVPAAFRPALERALQKDPAKRFDTMMEFARAVEAVPVGPTADGGTPPPRPVPLAIPVAPANLPIPPLARPAGPMPAAVRGRLAEVLGSLAAVPLVAALCTAPWVLFSTTVEWPALAKLFLMTTALSAAVVAFGRFAARPTADTWGRRGRMLAVGMGVGLLGFWLDGWTAPRSMTGSEADVPYREQYLGGTVRVSPESLSAGMRNVLYFGLAAAAFRWWTVTDRRQRERFRLFPVIAAGFWGTVLLFLWPWEAGTTGLHLVPLILSVVTVQLVCPWSPPPPAAPRRYRMRMA